MRTRTLTLALLSALVVASAGTAGALTASPIQPQVSSSNNTTSGGGSANQTGPNVVFEDQTTTGETVLVSSATLPEQGFVAIYDSTRSSNRTDQVVGASYLLEAGTSDNIRIQLDRPLNRSRSLLAVYHVDGNGNGEFDFVASDGQQDPAPPSGKDRTVSLAQITVANPGGTNATTAAATTIDGNATTTNEATTNETTRETTTDEPTTGESATTGSAADGSAATDAADAANGTSGGDANGSNGSGGSGDSGAFGPGFGPAVATVALLAAALLATRRRA